LLPLERASLLTRAVPRALTKPTLEGVLKKATRTNRRIREDARRMTARDEAELLLVALAEHQERELPDARAQLEDALRLEAGIPAIRADAAAGRVTAEQADAKIRVITASVTRLT
jgi:hypothetical protein